MVAGHVAVLAAKMPQNMRQKRISADFSRLPYSIAGQDWLDMLSGKQSGQMLFMSGKLKIKGDMGLAMKLGSMFSM